MTVSPALRRHNSRARQIYIVADMVTPLTEARRLAENRRETSLPPRTVIIRAGPAT